MRRFGYVPAEFKALAEAAPTVGPAATAP
jgi:hypothetical protein